MFNNLAAEIKRIGITNKDFAEKVKIKKLITKILIINL